MEHPLISVIVPVYKVEPYLDKCVSSIVNQTYKNLEIILVDDGSPDNCPAMCDAWAEKDQRIRVIHQKNKGGGAARNAGLDVAAGNLIAFVDSDDYLAPNIYDHLYKLLKRGADIAECNYTEVTDDNAEFSQKNDVYSYTTQEAMAEHIQDRFFRQLIWNKLYRRETIGSVRFPIDKKIDDEFFTYQILGNAHALIRSTMECYAYRQQPGSVMHTMPITKRIQAVEAKTMRHAYIQNHFPDLIGLSSRDLWFTCIYQGQLVIRNVGGGASTQTLDYLKAVLSENPVTMQGCSAKNRLWLMLARRNLNFTCKARNALKIGL